MDKTYFTGRTSLKNPQFNKAQKIKNQDTYIMWGVTTCTQQYCWDTQQTVNGQYYPSTKPVPEKFLEDVTPENIRKNLLPKEECGLQEELRNTFWKDVFRNFSRRRVFRKTTFFFRKNLLPEVILLALYFSNYLILITKLPYKINNIIIHKLLVNIIMSNICNSFFTRM